MADPPKHRQENSAQSLLKVLRHSGMINVERARQIYCNRDLNLGDVDAIGFDMDYTLALYKQGAMDTLSMQKTLERLVRDRGYPADILTIEARPDFAIRGLVLDKYRGNIFKLDSHRQVGKVYHGFEEVRGEGLFEYRTQSMRMTTDRYALLDTLFALPEAFLYAALVDYLETTRPNAQHDWPKLYHDIRYAIDLAHRDNSLKDEIMGDMDTYVERGADLALTLHKFRSSGKRLFVVTNSYTRYTDHLMAFLLDGVLPEYPSWRHYFDIIITGSAKPNFFTDRAPFLKVETDGRVLGEEYAGFERGQLYQGGNLIDFERMSGFRGDRVLFIGDHIYGDIVRSKKSSAWRTVMIVQEMEIELNRSEQLREETSRLDEIDLEIKRLNEEIAFDQGLAYKVDALLSEHDLGDSAVNGVAYDLETLRRARHELKISRDHMRRRRRELINQLIETEQHFEASFNPYWGLLFKMGNKNSIFGEQVEDYACLYTSRVSNFLNYSPLHYFRAPRQPMPHERY
ncbi:MAG: HAD-IG family 5'-nucleotidase [Bradymonadaceae bacterium]|nr:HAD-IG family 5'-nucleotidase [Lujinxingiaceae bacterium]